jgi:hypothetical protein
MFEIFLRLAVSELPNGYAIIFVGSEVTTASYRSSLTEVARMGKKSNLYSEQSPEQARRLEALTTVHHKYINTRSDHGTRQKVPTGSAHSRQRALFVRAKIDRPLFAHARPQ